MDIISHGLYGGVAFGRMRRRDYVTAFLFGIGPDLLAFAPLFIMNLISGGTMGRPSLETIPLHVFTVYGITHSFVVYAVLFAFLWFLGKKPFAKLTLAWPLHILVDIPTHDATFSQRLFCGRFQTSTSMEYPGVNQSYLFRMSSLSFLSMCTGIYSEEKLEAKAN